MMKKIELELEFETFDSGKKLGLYVRIPGKGYGIRSNNWDTPEKALTEGMPVITKWLIGNALGE